MGLQRALEYIGLQGLCLRLQGFRSGFGGFRVAALRFFSRALVEGFSRPNAPGVPRKQLHK